MIHSTKFIAVLLFTACFSSEQAFSQLQGATALLVGKLTDNSGTSLGGIKFSLNAEGKKIRGKTGSDGAFQQVVKPGITYVVEWQHPTVILRRDTVPVPNPGKYIEHSVTFIPAMINTGDMLAAENLFARGTAQISSETGLKAVAALLNEYPRLTTVITVGDDAPDPKAKKTKAKPAKKPKKGKVAAAAPVVAAPPLPALRTEAVTAFFSTHYPELRKRITVSAAVAVEPTTFTAKAGAIQPEM